MKLSDVICEIPHNWPNGVRWHSAGRPQVVNLSAVVRFGRLLAEQQKAAEEAEEAKLKASPMVSTRVLCFSVPGMLTRRSGLHHRLRRQQPNA